MPLLEQDKLQFVENARRVYKERFFGHFNGYFGVVVRAFRRRRVFESCSC